MLVQVQASFRDIAGCCFRLGQEVENATVLEDQGVMVEHLAFRFDGDDPAGIQQGGDGFWHTQFSRQERRIL